MAQQPRHSGLPLQTDTEGNRACTPQLPSCNRALYGGARQMEVKLSIPELQNEGRDEREERSPSKDAPPSARGLRRLSAHKLGWKPGNVPLLDEIALAETALELHAPLPWSEDGEEKETEEDDEKREPRWRSPALLLELSDFVGKSESEDDRRAGSTEVPLATMLSQVAHDVGSLKLEQKAAGALLVPLTLAHYGRYPCRQPNANSEGWIAQPAAGSQPPATSS